MGQAKTRGTLEQRMAQAVERQEQYRQLCIAQFRAREAAIPLAKRQRILRAPKTHPEIARAEPIQMTSVTFGVAPTKKKGRR